jgi:hypothetical protein
LHVEPDLEIHLVLDNLSAHKAPPVAEWLAHPPFICKNPAGDILTKLKRGRSARSHQINSVTHH